jgi:hypothetical protein
MSITSRNATFAEPAMVFSPFAPPGAALAWRFVYIRVFPGIQSCFFRVCRQIGGQSGFLWDLAVLFRKGMRLSGRAAQSLGPLLQFVHPFAEWEKRMASPKAGHSFARCCVR